MADLPVKVISPEAVEILPPERHVAVPAGGGMASVGRHRPPGAPKRSVNLTESAIARAARDVAEAGVRRDLVDAGCTGLRLRLTPAGGKTWVLACRDREGRMRRFVLGAFSDKKGEMGVAAARVAARALHVRVKHEGADPVATKRRGLAIGKDAKAGIGTLAALLDLYAGQKAGKNIKTWGEYRRRIECVFEAHLKRPIATMKSSDLQVSADAWSSQQSAGAAVRYLRPILKWAAGRNYADPGLATIQPPGAPGRRQRVLTVPELAALLPAMTTSLRPQIAAMKFMLFTLARREEVGAALWGDVNFAAAVWTIPPSNSKNGQEHEVPLSRQALALLRSKIPCGAKGRPATPPADALIFTTQGGGRLSNWDQETKRLMLDSGTQGWTRHDLRRTGATMLGEMGIEPHVIEAALNHVSISSQLAATYNRSRYRPQVAAALQRLADELDAIESGAALASRARPDT
jgi:integrase